MATKRLVEIDCPEDCPHLAAAREHPAAEVKRQQERDVAVLMPTIDSLTRATTSAVLPVPLGDRPPHTGRVRPLIDEDVGAGGGARWPRRSRRRTGVIYEHTPPSLPAQRLATGARRRCWARCATHGGNVYDAEAAIALRAIEQGARDASKTPASGPTAYVSLMARLLQRQQAATAARPGQTEPMTARAR